MIVKHYTAGDVDCLQIILTKDEIRCLLHTPQKGWMWRRFWLLLKYYI